MTESRTPRLPILIVDDELPILASYKMALQLGGFDNVVDCGDSRKVMNLLRKDGASVVLMDLQMPHLTGIDLLPQIAQEFPGLPVVVITGTDRVETGVQCMKAGAFDFLTKPVECERLLTTARQALSFAELRLENLALRDGLLSGGLKNPGAFAHIVTNNPAMRAVFQYVEAIAPTTQPVLITGETGVGKELLAKAVHAASGRRGEYVAVNVAGVEENVFSDTLFGHVKGAFTGADTVRGGLVERAAGGTLFLDEIADLSGVLQTKLLRLLQEREYFPLGSDYPKKTDARIVVATNENLEALQQAGRFRTDLYYRLCSHRVCLPPLRERLDDVALLTTHFLGDISEQLGRKAPHCPPEVMALLTSYHFPGNIRELYGIIYDAVSRQTGGTLSMDVFKERILQIPAHRLGAPSTSVQAANGQPSYGAKLPTLEEAKDHLIQEALRRAGRNRTLAASMLGVTRQALNLRERKERQGAAKADVED